MFGFSKKITPSSLISSNVVIDGSIKSETEIFVDGCVNGKITCKTLVVGINGKIKSSKIVVEKIIVNGFVDGNIEADSVYLGATARINGNIIHRDISIENGAFVSGEVKQKRS